MNTILRIMPMLILFLLSCAIALGMFNNKNVDPVDRLHYGLTFPYFELPSLTKDSLFTPKLFGNGQVMVVNVFASWCAPCAQEHGLLMRLASKASMYGVAWKDKSDNVFAYLKEKGNPFQMIGVDETGVITVPMAISGVPETYVLNKNGGIAFHYRAQLTEDIVNNVIIPLIDKLNLENVPAK